MRRTTSFIILVASSILLLQGARSEHAICHVTTDIPNAMERDSDKSSCKFTLLEARMFERNSSISETLLKEASSPYGSESGTELEYSSKSSSRMIRMTRHVRRRETRRVQTLDRTRNTGESEERRRSVVRERRIEVGGMRKARLEKKPRHAIRSDQRNRQVTRRLIDPQSRLDTRRTLRRNQVRSHEERRSFVSNIRNDVQEKLDTDRISNTNMHARSMQSRRQRESVIERVRNTRKMQDRNLQLLREEQRTETQRSSERQQRLDRRISQAVIQQTAEDNVLHRRREMTRVSRRLDSRSVDGHNRIEIVRHSTVDLTSRRFQGLHVSQRRNSLRRDRRLTETVPTMEERSVNRRILHIRSTQNGKYRLENQAERRVDSRKDEKNERRIQVRRNVLQQSVGRHRRDEQLQFDQFRNTGQRKRFLDTARMTSAQTKINRERREETRQERTSAERRRATQSDVSRRQNLSRLQRNERETDQSRRVLILRSARDQRSAERSVKEKGTSQEQRIRSSSELRRLTPGRVVEQSSEVNRKARAHRYGSGVESRRQTAPRILRDNRRQDDGMARIYAPQQRDLRMNRRNNRNDRINVRHTQDLPRRLDRKDITRDDKRHLSATATIGIMKHKSDRMTIRLGDKVNNRRVERTFGNYRFDWNGVKASSVFTATSLETGLFVRAGILGLVGLIGIRVGKEKK